MSENKSAAAMSTETHGLKKHDLKTSTVVFMIFSLVAAGAYGIEEMIPEAGPGLTIIMLAVLPFVWGVPFGLVASELGSVRPQEGGYYKWVQEALGEFWGFQAGWWRTISIYIDNTLYVILAGGYAASAWDLSRPLEFAVKVLMIFIFTMINIRGVRDVGIVSSVLSILVIVAFTLVAICGFMNWEPGTFGPLTPEPAESLSDWFFYIGAAISIGMWMYSGYESMSTIAGEVKNPQVIPKGTMISIPLIVAVYILPTTAGLGSLGMWEDWGTEADSVGYAMVVTHFWGPAFGIFFVIVAILAQCSIYNTYIASGSRGFFALADDYLAPPILVKTDAKRGVPYVAVLSVGIVNLILCMLPFGVIVVVDVFLLVSSYIMVYISAMILRKRIPREEYVFKIPGGYGFLTVLCIVPMIVAVLSFLINGSDYFIGGMVGIVTGPILYVIWRKRYGGLTKKNSEAFPGNPRTGLAVGDLRRMSGLFILLTVIGLVGVFFLPWYEGVTGWGGEYYYEGLFESAGDKVFAVSMTIIKVFTGICAVLAIILGIAANKVEPKKVTGESRSQIEN